MQINHLGAVNGRGNGMPFTEDAVHVESGYHLMLSVHNIHGYMSDLGMVMLACIPLKIQEAVAKGKFQVSLGSRMIPYL